VNARTQHSSLTTHLTHTITGQSRTVGAVDDWVATPPHERWQGVDATMLRSGAMMARAPPQHSLVREVLDGLLCALARLLQPLPPRAHLHVDRAREPLAVLAQGPSEAHLE
jgi:hypothetical protein